MPVHLNDQCRAHLIQIYSTCPSFHNFDFYNKYTVMEDPVQHVHAKHLPPCVLLMLRIVLVIADPACQSGWVAIYSLQCLDCKVVGISATASEHTRTWHRHTHCIWLQHQIVHVAHKCSNGVRLKFNLWLPNLLQRAKDGTPATAITTTEFTQKVMFQNFIPASKGVVLKHAQFFEQWGEPLWSYDNATVHLNKTEMAAVGITEANRLPLPPLSGDMHKVIEHVHARLIKAFKEEVVKLGRVCEPHEYMELLSSLFFKIITADQIARDVDSLKPLYAAIIKAQGGQVAQKWLR